eukprot:12992552-Ditylum_brightwellii.AAC.1
MGSNVAAFINVKTQTYIEMYNSLLSIFQGKEHKKDTAVNATQLWESPKFNSHTKDSPEIFLAKINECLKCMEVDDDTKGTTKPFSGVTLPSLLQAKIDHPSFATWKA